jgi:hypothetical protein
MSVYEALLVEDYDGLISEIKPIEKKTKRLRTMRQIVTWIE